MLAGNAVGKRAKPVSALRTFAGLTAAEARREPGKFVVAGGAMGAPAALTEKERRERRRSAGNTVAVLGAGAAGQGAFRAVGHGIKHQGNKRVGEPMPELKLPGGFVRPGQTKSQLRAATSAWRQQFGIDGANSQAAREAIQNSPKAMRAYPESASAPFKRALGHMSGRRGHALSAVATGVPAAAMYRHRRVEKAVYGVQESRTSRPRQAEFLTGTALAAYGLSRHKMLGPLAAYGARVAERQGAKPEQVDRVMSAARAVTRGVRQKTGQGEAYVRQIQALDHAIDAIPAGLRPAVATTAGVMLVNHARPVTRERFVPQGRY